MLRPGIRRVFRLALRRRDVLRADVEEELAHHLALSIEALGSRGLPPDEARAEALRRLGVAAAAGHHGAGTLRDVNRMLYRAARRREGRMRIREWLGAARQDLRYALRRLTREAGFSIPVVATLAIGIGVTTAVFAVVNATLMRPLPYADADRLVVVRHAASRAELPMNGASPGTVNLYRAGSRAFEAIGLYSEQVVTLSDLDRPEQVRVASVTPAVLDVLRPAVFVGRWLAPGHFGRDRFDGVLISHDLWVRRYGADPHIVGRTIELERRRASVSGVLAPGFGFPAHDTDVWDAVTWPDRDVSHARLRELAYGAIARLRPGVTIADAERDLERVARGFSDVFADVAPHEVEEMGLRASVVPLDEAIIGSTRVPLLLLAGTALFLFVITQANASNLTLVRATRLRRVVAVERALGASRMRLALRFAIESMVLTTLGATAGMALAALAVRVRFGFSPDAIPRLHEVRMDAAAVSVTAALAVMSAVVLGGVAWLGAVGSGAAARLSGAGRATTGYREQAMARLLVAGQIALALALMIGSALMAESFRKLSRVQLGFRPGDALIFSLPVPPLAVARNDASEVPFLYHRVARLDAEVLARLRALPGVRAAEAASVSGFPLTPVASSYNTRVAVAGRPEGSREASPYAQRSFATPGYFDAMGIPVLRGRSFRVEDTGSRGHGVILSASLATALFGDEDPVGRHVRWASRAAGPEFAVVGVVGDVASEGIRHGPTKVLYLPNIHPPLADTVTGVVHFHIPNDEMFVVRTALPAAAVLPAIQRLVREVDPKLMPTRVGTLDALVSDDTARTRLTMLLLLVASAVALLLGMIGVYGVLSYAVSQRGNEIGVRMALGQTPGSVVGMVMWQGARLVLAGIAAGLLTAFALTRYLRSLLYEVSPSDPGVFAAMALLLAGVACAASVVPARRASRVDPAQALKAQ